MSSLRERVKHAFAVDPPGPAEPTDEQRPAVERVCREVARRRLTTPGLIGLEMSRPLNYIAAQAMHVWEPAVWAVFPQKTHEGYKHFAKFLEHRGAIEYIMLRIEEIEQEMEQAERAGSRAAPGAPEEEHDDDRS
jgi:hypothetical protein